MNIFLFLCVKDTLYELKKYWIALERKGYQPTESYLESLSEYETESANLAKIIYKVAKFLRATFHYEGARNLLHRVLVLIEEIRTNSALCLKVVEETE
jgi:hypothetical protein